MMEKIVGEVDIIPLYQIIIKLIVSIFAYGHVLWIMSKHKITIKQAILGDDEKPQFNEILMALGLFLITPVIIIDVITDGGVSTETYLFLAALLGWTDYNRTKRIMKQKELDSNENIEKIKQDAINEK